MKTTKELCAFTIAKIRAALVAFVALVSVAKRDQFPLEIAYHSRVVNFTIDASTQLY
jgi:hypothetical protein